MFNFMKKGPAGPMEREEKEKRKKEKREQKERKDGKKRDRSSMTAEELLRLDEVYLVWCTSVTSLNSCHIVTLLFISFSRSADL